MSDKMTEDEADELVRSIISGEAKMGFESACLVIASWLIPIPNEHSNARTKLEILSEDFETRGFKFISNDFLMMQESLKVLLNVLNKCELPPGTFEDGE